MAKQNHELHIKVEREFKEELEAKANYLGISLSDFVRLVLANSLRGELVIHS